MAADRCRRQAGETRKSPTAGVFDERDQRVRLSAGAGSIMTVVALVGGASALARRLVPVLEERSEVVTLGRSGCDIHCDLLEGVESIRIPEGAEAVVHLSAAYEGRGDDAAVRTVEVNVVGTLKVCAAAKRAGVGRVVLISTAYAPLGPDSPSYSLYSLTKRQAEELAIDYCREHDLPLTILRCAPFYAEDDAFRRHQPFLYHMADLAERGEDIELFGTHDARRNYIHADDVSRVVQKVLERGCGGVHLSAFPEDVSLGAVAAAALEAFGRGGKVTFVKEKPDVPDNTFGHEPGLYVALGFTPRIDVREGMRRLARYRESGRSS